MKVNIKNEMETAVRGEISRLQGRDDGSLWLPRIIPGGLFSRFTRIFGKARKSTPGCSCPLCGTDIVALALSVLPPCYCRSVHYGIKLERVDSDLIQHEVQKAMRRVGFRPRHSALQPVPAVMNVRLVDYGLKEGSRMIGPLLKRLAQACECNACQEDTLAYGLNRYKPRYGVELEGRMRILPHQLDFLRHELLNSLSQAAETVALNPRHGGKEGP